jgi:hypothetical protein
MSGPPRVCRVAPAFIKDDSADVLILMTKGFAHRR